MWIDVKKYDFVKQRVVEERRWVEIDSIIEHNPFLRHLLKKGGDAEEEEK